ncbi:sigma-70 family RNA polymerase sigma factor [Hymenobacter lutimineralis]|uniref:Sigma-70 family RNA polymerase sigma factor n=1 Tax=Hymenobacter lutimineralis TaxID=2606448 RepID=A0A5D6V4P2_9BACT|nr:sigma-70 family RNA polymerase sigma factor [Hymenobacter lutimineralis]TYZ10576.1 sigma-70 family RNA polymerase sigma factor [Hymenobacter lutimineralis]
MKTTSETALLEACRQGEARAQRLLYDRLAPKMLTTCRRYLRNPDDAEEAMMSGFVKVFRGLGSFRHEGSFEGWVRRIMVRECLNVLGRHEPLLLAFDDCPGLAPALPAAAETDLHTADLLALVQALPAGYRTVFNLFALEGYNHPEIAALLGISEGTSKSQLSKARTLLQRRVAALSLSSTPETYSRYAA